MASKPEAGEEVAWETSQGTTTGKVVRKLTKPTRIRGHVAKASKDEPQYLVQSEKTGGKAAHRPEALRKP